MIAAPPPALHFHAAAGWRSGTAAHAGVYGSAAAWTATGVRYRDDGVADPPNRTLPHLHGRAIVIVASLDRGVSAPAVPRSLAGARRFACCEAFVPPWPFLLEVGGRGLVIHVYFGRAPDAALRAAVVRRLRVLEAGQ